MATDSQFNRLRRRLRVFWHRRVARRGASYSVRTKQIIIAVLGFAFLVSLLFVQGMEVARHKRASAKFVRHEPPASSKSCVECHQKSSPGIVDHWAFSTHAAKGVGCVECHQASEGEPDAFRHYGPWIATVVTPLDCRRCHQREADEFASSHHAKGGHILESLDNFLAETVEGSRVPFNPHSPTPGMKVESLFGVEFGPENELNARQLPDSVRAAFEKNNKPLPKKVSVSVVKASREWYIDAENSMYGVRKDDDALRIYKVDTVNGMASAFVGCQQCHGSKVALQSTDPEKPKITVDDLKPVTLDDVQRDPNLLDKLGQPTNTDILASIKRSDQDRRPLYHQGTWPNTGIGRINLDGSLGSCSACHSRHDFSPRRARQPENCGKCHLGPDHPQKEIYEESKHGVAFRDLKDHMHLDAESWVLGEDYTQAPTCATCHMSAHTRNGKTVTHNPGRRISWTNRPPVSRLLDNWEQRRDRMKDVCLHCHTPDYVNAFYKQYDDFVVLYNEKFAKPGEKIMAALREQKLITPTDFDEEIEWTWFYLWHHEGRRARHGASMMAPDYAHWHGMFEVAERFYQELIPQARKIASHADSDGKKQEAEAVRAVIDAILRRPEHAWQQRPSKPVNKNPKDARTKAKAS